MKKKIILSIISFIICSGFSSSSDSILLSFVVPNISHVIQLPDNQVKLQANFPRTVNVTNGYLTNCNLDGIILDVICDIVPDNSGLPIVIEINIKE